MVTIRVQCFALGFMYIYHLSSEMILETAIYTHKSDRSCIEQLNPIIKLMPNFLSRASFLTRSRFFFQILAARLFFIPLNLSSSQNMLVNLNE